MATVFESSFLSSRLHRIEERYEEPANTFGKCDCTSYSYLALSVVFLTIGTVITIFSLGDVADGHVLSNLGEMWFIGPIFICSGLTLAVKCMLYLRKKSVVRQMIFHRRQLFRVSMYILGYLVSSCAPCSVVLRSNALVPVLIVLSLSLYTSLFIIGLLSVLVLFPRIKYVPLLTIPHSRCYSQGNVHSFVQYLFG